MWGLALPALPSHGVEVGVMGPVVKESFLKKLWPDHWFIRSGAFCPCLKMPCWGFSWKARDGGGPFLSPSDWRSLKPKTNLELSGGSACEFSRSRAVCGFKMGRDKCEAEPPHLKAVNLRMQVFQGTNNKEGGFLKPFEQQTWKGLSGSRSPASRKEVPGEGMELQSQPLTLQPEA